MRAGATLSRPSRHTGRSGDLATDVPPGMGSVTTSSLSSLLVPGAIDTRIVRQISAGGTELLAVRPQLGWKPNEEPPFTSEGIERVMHRRGLAAEVTQWKLESGSTVLDNAGVPEDVGIIIDVDAAHDSGAVAAVVRDWCGGGTRRRPVVVEVPELALADAGAVTLAAGLRGAGADVAVHSCSGELSALRAVRRANPAYLRIDAAGTADDEAARRAFRMVTLVAAVEGWRTVATGVTTTAIVAFARSCGVDRLEGPSTAV